MTNKPTFDEAIRIHAKCSTVTFNKKLLLPSVAKEKQQKEEEEIFKKENTKIINETYVKKCEPPATGNEKSAIEMNFESPTESVEIIKACKDGHM